MRSGSVADHLRDLLEENGYNGKYHVKAVENIYVQHAAVQSSLKALGLDGKSMADAIK